MRTLTGRGELRGLPPIMTALGMVLIALAVVHALTGTFVDAATPLVIGTAVLAAAWRLAR